MFFFKKKKPLKDIAQGQVNTAAIMYETVLSENYTEAEINRSFTHYFDVLIGVQTWATMEDEVELGAYLYEFISVDKFTKLIIEISQKKPSELVLTQSLLFISNSLSLLLNTNIFQGKKREEVFQNITAILTILAPFIKDNIKLSGLTEIINHGEISEANGEQLQELIMTSLISSGLYFEFVKNAISAVKSLEPLYISSAQTTNDKESENTYPDFIKDYVRVLSLQ